MQREISAVANVNTWRRNANGREPRGCTEEKDHKCGSKYGWSEWVDREKSNVQGQEIRHSDWLSQDLP